jgi:catechol 2,3-dioxygenase-like lactoylglutathione lyase family enzyme
MTIRLDHTIVPVKDKTASAEFFAAIFGLEVRHGHFARVQVNKSLTLDFTDDPEAAKHIHHYAFHVSDAEFDAILGRLKTRGLPYGSAPFNRNDGRLYRLRGGRGVYFDDPNGHILEIMTVAETGSWEADETDR